MREEFLKEDFQIELDRDRIFQLMECYEDSPVYDIVMEEWEDRQEEMQALLQPKVIAVLDEPGENYGRKDLKESAQVFYVIQTIGEGLGNLSTQLFSQDDALAGMMADAAADMALEALGQEVATWLKEICREKNIGILRRLEAPGQVPMQVQKEILEKTGAKERYGIDVSSGYMFFPVKSMGYILITTNDVAVFRVEHNCRTCDRKDCKVRAIQPVCVEICKKNEENTILVSDREETVLQMLTKSDASYSFPCGGRGLCGKCKIQVLQGDAFISKEDRNFFTEKELEEGYRLACTLVPTEDLKIRFLGEQDEDFEALGEEEQQVDMEDSNAEYAIAIDIGTTTLAVSLIHVQSQQTVKVYTAMNRQRKYGADVISRIQASCEGKKELLKQCIREDLLDGMGKVLQESKVGAEQVKHIAIAGNTTMGHLLMGLECRTLGVAPFTPVDISMRQYGFEQVFGNTMLQADVLLLPGISTYVGADITAGMYTCGFMDNKKICMLIDLGTNGEMAIGNCEKILVTSTAAGPAFEGGNISCGIGSVPGAVCDVTINGTETELKTIADRTPVGLCGTGVIATVAELLKNEWIDETGLLDDEYFDDGFLLAKSEEQAIVFTQKDVREMQLAIAAVRAGIETLLLRYGVQYEDVDKIYLAGGFGYKMNLDKAIAVGLLPGAWRGKIEAVGNSSLAGAKKSLLCADAQEVLERICAISTEVSLSGDKDFNELYMEHMMFEEDM